MQKEGELMKGAGTHRENKALSLLQICGRRSATLLRRARQQLGSAGLACERGQAAVEYTVITFMLLGGGALSWPFTVRLINAMNVYYQSIFAAIQAPLP